MSLKETVRQGFEGFLAGERNYSDLFTDNFVNHGHPGDGSLENVRAYRESEQRRYRDMNMRIDDVLEDGNKVAVRWHISGTDATTGDRKSWNQVAILRIEDGKIAERWGADTSVPNGDAARA
jgi:predicted SnoaL-like aldol condensation-catalyzing enzyme